MFARASLSEAVGPNRDPRETRDQATRAQKAYPSKGTFNGLKPRNPGTHAQPQDPPRDG